MSLNNSLIIGFSILVYIFMFFFVLGMLKMEWKDGKPSNFSILVAVAAPISLLIILYVVLMKLFLTVIFASIPDDS